MRFNEIISTLYHPEDESLNIQEDRKREILDFIESQGELKRKRPRSKTYNFFSKSFSVINSTNIIQATAAVLAILILTFSIRHLATRKQNNYAQNNTPKETLENVDKNANSDNYEDVKPVNNEKLPKEPNIQTEIEDTTDTESKDDTNTDNNEQKTPTIENYDVQDKLTMELLKEKIVGEWVGTATEVNTGISPYAVKLIFAADGNFKSYALNQAYRLDDPSKRRIMALMTGIPNILYCHETDHYKVTDVLTKDFGAVEIYMYAGPGNWDPIPLYNVSFYGNYSRLKFSLDFEGTLYEYDLNNKGILPDDAGIEDELRVAYYSHIENMKLSSDLSTLYFEFYDPDKRHAPITYNLKRKSSSEKLVSKIDNTVDSFQKGLVGTWVGTATPFTFAPYEVEITFYSNGKYSAHSTSESINPGSRITLPALYYGVDDDSDLKTYSIDYISENNEASGTIAICFKY